MRISNGRGWSKSGTLPTGNDFLPDTNTQILLEMIAACPPGKVRDILRACYERKINASIRRIRDLLMRPYSTVREWLWRVHERGLDNISDRNPPGARGILGPEEIEIVRGQGLHAKLRDYRYSSSTATVFSDRPFQDRLGCSGVRLTP